MKANIIYKDKIYIETTMAEIEKRHPDMNTGDRFEIDGQEVIVVEMKYDFENQVVDIFAKDFTGDVKDL